jgi:hypothetical protein
MSARLTFRLVGLSGIASAIALVGHFVVAGPPTTFTSQRILETTASQHTALATGAWLDGIGSTLLIVTFLGIAQLAGLAGTLAGRILLLGGSAVVAHSLLTDSLLIAASQISSVGDPATAASLLRVAHATDYAFPIANSFWAPALGLIVLRSHFLPTAFGYVAIAFGAVEVVGGLAALYSDAVNAVIDPFFLVMVAWAVAAGMVLIQRSLGDRLTVSGESRLGSAPAIR